MDWNLITAARTLWQEARSEPLDGQRAVAHVIINRMKSGRYGSSLAEVCLYHAQFSGWWCPRGTPPKVVHDPNFAAACHVSDTDPLLLQLAGLIQAAQTEPDPTNGATNYYAPKVIGEPDWVEGDPAHGTPAAIFCGQFGTQLFYKGIK